MLLNSWLILLSFLLIGRNWLLNNFSLLSWLNLGKVLQERTVWCVKCVFCDVALILDLVLLVCELFLIESFVELLNVLFQNYLDVLLEIGCPI